MFERLVNDQTFTKIDLAQAYIQVPSDQEARRLAIVNTHRGLNRHTRILFGISSAHAVFQQLMEKILKGIPGARIYLDDLLGKDNAEHFRNQYLVDSSLMS